MKTHPQNAGGSSLPSDDMAEEFVLRLLERIVAGDGSAADEAALAAWVGDHPGRRRVVDRLRAVLGAVPEAHDPKR